MAESPTSGTGDSDGSGPSEIPPSAIPPQPQPPPPPPLEPPPQLPRLTRALQDFDPSAVHPLDWTTMGIGALAFVASFASYYSYTEKVTIAGFSESRTQSWNAWHGLYGWLAALAALAAAAVLAADLLGIDLPMPPRLAVLSGFSFALLMTVVALVVVPSRLGFNGVGVVGIRTTEGHTFGYWLSLLLMFGGSALALVRFVSTGSKVR